MQLFGYIITLVYNAKPLLMGLNADTNNILEHRLE